MAAEVERGHVAGDEDVYRVGSRVIVARERRAWGHRDELGLETARAVQHDAFEVAEVGDRHRVRLEVLRKARVDGLGVVVQIVLHAAQAAQPTRRSSPNVDHVDCAWLTGFEPGPRD
jgi:hypothetical protein